VITDVDLTDVDLTDVVHYPLASGNAPPENGWWPRTSAAYRRITAGYVDHCGDDRYGEMSIASVWGRAIAVTLLTIEVSN
jgi:hypothetical protein